MGGRTWTDEEMEEVFQLLDQNGSGQLEMSELGNALKLLNIDLTEAEIIEQYGMDDDPESLNLEEFKTFIRERIETMGIDFRQRVVDAFIEFDDTGEGKVTRETLLEILTARGSNPLSQEEAEELIAECDRDGNGIFDAQEMADILCAAMDR